MVAPKKATTAPTKKVSKKMMGTALRPISSIWATTELKRQLRTTRILRAQVVRMRPTKAVRLMKCSQKRSVAEPIRTSRLESQVRRGGGGMGVAVLRAWPPGVRRARRSLERLLDEVRGWPRCAQER